MTDDEKKLDELMDSRLRDIESAESERKQSVTVREAVKRGYVGVGQSASGVIFQGR